MGGLWEHGLDRSSDSEAPLWRGEGARRRVGPAPASSQELYRSVPLSRPRLIPKTRSNASHTHTHTRTRTRTRTHNCKQTDEHNAGSGGQIPREWDSQTRQSMFNANRRLSLGTHTRAH